MVFAGALHFREQRVFAVGIGPRIEDHDPDAVGLHLWLLLLDKGHELDRGLQDRLSVFRHQVVGIVDPESPGFAIEFGHPFGQHLHGDALFPYRLGVTENWQDQ